MGVATATLSTGWWELRHLPLKHSGNGLKIANVSIRPVSRTPARLLHDVQMLLYCFRPHSELGVCPHASDTGSQDLSKRN